MGVKIGNLELRHGLMLAPMAGFSDRAMRCVCHRLGAEYSVTEMVSAKAVTYGDRKTERLARILPDEGPVGLQIFGSDPDIMARATEILSSGMGGEGYARPASIDINMGCPVNKVFGNGEGSALMRDPGLIRRIVMSVKDSTDLPVTVKLRAGIDKNSINAVECALYAEAGGADLVCIHGRTRVEMYSGRADRNIIADVKRALHIPVIANGDVLTGEDAVSMLRDTGADGIAVGRGAVGNPYIFSEIIAALEGNDYTPPRLNERVELALYQLRVAIEDKGERIAVPESRKQIALYLRSFPGAAMLRGAVNLATTYSEVENILRAIPDEGQQ